MQRDDKRMTTTGFGGRAILGRAGGGAAALVRAVAGMPAGVARTRRGTFLVVVIGTLALLAVIAIAHFAIGQADRRASASLERATKIDDIPEQFARHVLGVIGNDTLGVVPEELNEVMTPGSPDYLLRYMAKREAFDSPFTDWRSDSLDSSPTVRQGGFDLPNRKFFTPEGVGSDPWLASTAPTWLNWDGDPVAGGTAEFQYRRDWAHISNLAPDGRFINLVNLRNNFAAEPGYGSAGGRPRTSQGLGLLGKAGPGAAGGPTPVTDFGVPLSRLNRRPATWDSRQRGAFRPVKEWNGLRPDAAAYAPNQWADADGDGYYDSRWFELVDARDLGSVRSYLQTDGRLRWVFAVRVIDLSGLLNANTATDSRYEPGAAHPVGLNPADVDLKRLLSLQDSYAEWGVGYDAILQPQEGVPTNYGGMTAQLGVKLGKGAYDSVRWSIAGALVPDRYNTPAWDWLGGGVAAGERGVLRQQAWRGVGGSVSGASYDATNGAISLPSQFPSSDMGELLGRFGANDPLETSRLEAATAGRRGAGAGPAAVTETAFDPLRSNRDPRWELNRTSTAGAQGRLTEVGFATPEAMLLSAVDVRSQLTTMSWARPVANLYGNDFVGAGYPKGNEFLLASEERLALATKLAADQKPAGSDLFRMYVRSLAPAVKLTGVWPRNGVLPAGGGEDFQKAKTLFYGHQGPETALAAAGGMAVNAEVMLSNDGKIDNPRTLVFSADLAQQTYRSPGAARRNADNVPAMPWFKNGSYCLEPDVEDLPPILASGNDVKLQSPVLNLYGFEPQAFITEVGCFTVWRDTPRRRGGDLDEYPVNPNNPNEPPPGYITLRGAMDGDNKDLMFRCVALQLHNPYSEAVTVTTVPQRSGSTQVDDWREFQYVKIQSADQRTLMGAAVLCDAQITPAGELEASGLTLQPGETVVCCLFSRRPDAQAAWLAARGMFANTAAAASFMRDWAQRQFVDNGVRRAVFALGVNDAVTDVTSAFKNYIEDPDGSRGMTVQLWKARRANMAEYGGADETAGAAARNVTGNDQLLDRLRVPAGAGRTLDERITAGPVDPLGREGVEVDGCFGGSEMAGFDAATNYNTGLTVMRWATVSRPTDPKDGAGNTIPLGAVPAYVLEPKNPSAEWHVYKSEDSGVLPNATLRVSKAVIDRLQARNHEGEFEETQWVTRARSTAASTTINKGPDQKSAADVPPIGSNLDSRPFAQVRDLMPRAARADKGFNGGQPEGVFAAKVPGQTPRTSTLRAADLLLPMAISPWESPLKPDLTPQDNPNIRHLTASEAFAVAYGYDVLPAPSAGNDQADPVSLYGPAAAAPNDPDGTIGSTQPRPVIEGGHVVVDDFVPFYDGNQNGRFDRGNAYNGIDFGQATQRDIRFGLGIPAALNVLDQVNPYEDQYGSLRRAVPGVVNINTATPTVLRCLPLLTPADRAWGSGNDLIWDNGWEQTKTNIDLAASVLAYRDKRPTVQLPGRAAPAAFDGDASGGTQRPPFSSLTRFTEFQAGRAQATHMDGIREELGFMSVGELGCVIQRTRDDRGGSATTRNNPRSIDFLGFNNQSRNSGGLNNDRKGVNSLQFRDATAGTTDVDGLRNDFAERLQVLTALSNVASVRSDVFACWFVVRGYAQDDCENLGPDDPMTPSVERRFLMVIDRSNVTSLQKDPKPRVVMFKELPR